MLRVGTSWGRLVGVAVSAGVLVGTGASVAVLDGVRLGPDVGDRVAVGGGAVSAGESSGIAVDGSVGASGEEVLVAAETTEVGNGVGVSTRANRCHSSVLNETATTMASRMSVESRNR
jgi:hypothetical protein